MRESWSFTKLAGAMKVKVRLSMDPGRIPARGALPARLDLSVDEAEQERTRWDPKDGELCLRRANSGETLMEARSDTDVQIVRHTWV